jgi:hypothetical protein
VISAGASIDSAEKTAQRALSSVARSAEGDGLSSRSVQVPGEPVTTRKTLRAPTTTAVTKMPEARKRMIFRLRPAF